jgi:hypothetical protein
MRRANGCSVFGQLETENSASCRLYRSIHSPRPAPIHINRRPAKKPAIKRACNFAENSSAVLVELSGIEPLTSSLRIQGMTSDGEIPNDTE